LDVASGSTFCSSRSNRGSDRSTSKSGSTTTLTRDVQRRSEQRERFLLLATLREAAGGDHQRPTLPVRLSALAQQRLKAAPFEGESDVLGPLRSGHPLA
jgi:hypothetical protein